MAPKVKINGKEVDMKPKVHYTDIIDPEGFKKTVIPAVVKALEEVSQEKVG